MFLWAAVVEETISLGQTLQLSQTLIVAALKEHVLDGPVDRVQSLVVYQQLQ